MTARTATRRTPSERQALAAMDPDSVAAGRRFWRAHAPAKYVGLTDATPDRPRRGSAGPGGEAARRAVRGSAAAAVFYGHGFPLRLATGGVTAGGGWRFLGLDRVYERVKGGARAGADKVRPAVEKVAKAGERLAERLGQALVKGRLAVGDWQAKMEQLIKSVHAATGLIGAGGVGAATDADLAEIEAKVLHQFDYLERFAVAVEEGLKLDGKIPPRAGQYLTASVGTYEGVRRVGDLDAGWSFERRLLHSIIPCDPCQEYADMGWQPALVLPDVGEDCTCLSRCLCSFERSQSDPRTGPQTPTPKPPTPKPGTQPKIPYTDPTLPEAVRHAKRIRGVHDAVIGRLAADHGVTPRQLKVELDAGFKAAVDAGEFYLRVDPGVLPRVLESGRFKSQFETGASVGLLDPEARASAEAALFGTLPGVGPAGRPIYGYVSRPGFASFGKAPEAAVEDYGGAAVRLKPGVRARATVTGSDSLGSFDTVAGTPAAAPDSSSLPLRSADFRPAYEDTLKGNADPGEWLDAIGSGFGYLEAQYHGGLSVADVADVAFASPPPERVKAALRKEGIPWRVIKR